MKTKKIISAVMDLITTAYWANTEDRIILLKKAKKLSNKIRSEIIFPVLE